jgi:hypothetical protein
MRHALLGLIIALLACVALWAQSPEPRFDVVSIKRSMSPEQGGRNALEPGRYVGLGVTLRRIVGLAYTPVPAVTPSTANCQVDRCNFQYLDGLIRGRGVTLDQIAGEITAGRTVVNQTGLGGVYDIELRWTPDGTPPAGDDAPPTLVTALREQLGLKLEPDTMMLDFLVIDAAERPQEN